MKRARCRWRAALLWGAARTLFGADDRCVLAVRAACLTIQFESQQQTGPGRSPCCYQVEPTNHRRHTSPYIQGRKGDIRAHLRFQSVKTSNGVAGWMVTIQRKQSRAANVVIAFQREGHVDHRGHRVGAYLRQLLEARRGGALTEVSVPWPLAAKASSAPAAHLYRRSTHPTTPGSRRGSCRSILSRRRLTSRRPPSSRLSCSPPSSPSPWPRPDPCRADRHATGGRRPIRVRRRCGAHRG
jgi:hypothetical protein